MRIGELAGKAGSSRAGGWASVLRASLTLKEIHPLVNLHRAAARMTASGGRHAAEFRDTAQLAG